MGNFNIAIALGFMYPYNSDNQYYSPYLLLEIRTLLTYLHFKVRIAGTRYISINTVRMIRV